MKRNYLIYALLMTVFLSSNVISAQNYFGDFPVKADPKTVGNKLSRRLMETKHQLAPIYIECAKCPFILRTADKIKLLQGIYCPAY